jgi:ribonuclease BN (tRNA processing enzyme)
VKLILIPSSVGGGEPHQFLSSTLVNDSIVLDAGCIGLYRSAQEQARVRHVFISHTHIDHLASLPVFVENAYEGKSECVTVHASQEVLDCCRRYLFNDLIWPDFVALSDGERPFLRLSRFEAGESLEIDGVRVTAVAVNHVVPTVGYVVADATSAVAVVSDTGPTDAIWQRLNEEPKLKAVFLETTFPNELRWLAEVSKHLTPAMAAEELRKLSRPARVIAVHLKARFRPQVEAELRAAGIADLEFAKFDVPYEF